jgi:stage III sporulation protein AE
VLGCTNVLKNAVGIVGIIIVIGICINPILKLLSLMAVYYIGAAICEPLADTKIVKLLEQIGGTFKLFLAIMISVAVMLIIGITLVINISSSTLMIS